MTHLQLRDGAWEVWHVLNLGLGVPSTWLYLLFAQGVLQPKLDAAIFADTGGESQLTYAHLAWMQSISGPPILVRTAGDLEQDLRMGRRAAGTGRARFASLPAYVRNPDGSEGRLKRQCTHDYKVRVVERTIRSDILDVRRVPRRVRVNQYFGLTFDEAARAARVLERPRPRWSVPRFPLVALQVARANCLAEITRYVPHPIPRSACVFCPFRTDAEWQWLKENDPAGWQRAVAFDRDLRTGDFYARGGLRGAVYLHRSRRPLEEVSFRARIDPRALQLSLSFVEECSGMCGL